MILSENFMFLHYPKTAGKSLSRYFIQAWEDKLVCYLSEGQLNEVKDLLRDNIELKKGRAHENFSQSLALFKMENFRNTQPEAVFICLRIPYDLPISTYFFHRERADIYPDREIFHLAGHENLIGFWKKVNPPNPENWYACESFKNGNIEYIRFETMVEDLEKLSVKYGFKNPPLNHLNSTNRDSYKNYLDKELEEVIYHKLNFFFQYGYYQRELVKHGEDY